MWQKDEDRGHRRGRGVVGTGGRGGYSSMVQQGQQRVVLAAASGGPPGCCRSTTAAAEGALALRSLLMGQEPFLSCPSPERPVFCPGTGTLRPNSFLLSLIKTAHGDFSLNTAELKHVGGGIQARWNPDSLTKFKTTRATSIQCTKEKCKLNRSHSEFWLFCPFLFQLYDTKIFFYIIQGKIFNSVKLSDNFLRVQSLQEESCFKFPRDWELMSCVSVETRQSPHPHEVFSLTSEIMLKNNWHIKVLSEICPPLKLHQMN